MATFRAGETFMDVDPENEAAFEAAGWGRVDDPKPKKSDKDDEK